MKCDNCDKEVIIPDIAQSNMRTYHMSCVTISECCGVAYSVNPIVIIKYDIRPYKGSQVEDDWGNDITKELPEGD